MGIPFSVVQGLISIMDTAGNIVETVLTAGKRRLTTQTSIIGSNAPYIEAHTVERYDRKNALCVDSVISVITAMQSWTKKLRYEDLNASNGGVARGTAITSNWTQLYSYSGIGYIGGFILNVETFADWAFRFVIDGEELFGGTGLLSNDLTNDTIYDIDDITDVNQAYLGLSKGSHDRFVYHPPLGNPLRYEVSVQIYVKRMVGATKKFQGGMIIIQKDS